MNFAKLEYAFDGLLRRAYQRRTCPSCSSDRSEQVDRKGLHELLRCTDCRLLYRYPYESPEEMARFYRRSYRQPGLTTDLPDAAELAKLLAIGFKGTSKDCTRIIGLFDSLKLARGSSVLDFGANWGYGVWQLRQAGFPAVGYEPAETRAKFSERLGVDVFSKWSEIELRAPFDVVFSSHVLEHTPDPAAALRQQVAVLAPGGTLIALMPNGSRAFRLSEPDAFHRLWGQVHPVMLTDEFARRQLPGGLAMGACVDEDLTALGEWNHATFWVGTISRSELLIVWCKPPAGASPVTGNGSWGGGPP